MYRQPINIFLTIVAVIFYNSIVAQKSFSLQSAQQYALEHNQEIANAQLDEKIMDAKIWETTAIGLPQISAEGKFQNFIDIPTSVLPAKAFNPLAPEGELIGLQFGTNYNLTGGLQLSQIIFSGNYLVGLQATKATSGLYQLSSEKKEIDIKSNIAEAFYTVLILKENESTLAAMQTKMEVILDLTKKLVAEEVMISTNAAQLELGVLQIKNAIKTLKAQTQLAKQLLKFQMGYPMEDELNVEGNVSREAMQFESVINPETNIDYRLVHSQLGLKELSLKNTKANYLPSLYGFFSYQQQAQRNDFDFFDANKQWYPTTLWGLTLNVPIFGSGQRHAQVTQAKLEVEKTNNTLTNLSEGLKLQIFQATTNYQLAQDKLDLQIQTQKVAEKVLEDTEKLYKESVVSSIELTQAQSQLLTEKTNYTNALFELIKAKIALEKLAQ